MDPANILTITTSKFDDYGKSAWVGEASKHIGNGVLMSEGEAWKQSRIRLRPIFSKAMLDETKLVEPHFERLRKQLGHQRGAIVDFQEFSTRLILDIVTDFLFGKSIESLNEDANGQGRHFLSLVRQFEPASGSFIAVGVFAWVELIPFYRQLLRVVDGMKTFFYAQLQAVLSDTSRKSNGTSCFRTMMKDNVPVQQVQAELQNIFFASFDTTNALLCNVIEVVSKRQDIQVRLRDEISCLQGVLPTRRDVQNFTYLRFVILEGKYTTLRLYTPVTSHSRIALRDTTFPRGGGPTGTEPIFVPAGTTVNWSIYSLNRDPDIYGADWADFRPERWEKPGAGSTNGSFLPFGSGPRACMGREMALMEVSYILVRLLQEFPILKGEDTREFKEAKAVSFYNANGVLMSLK
ncbi:hypothetical protein K4F52_008593 [Lecanicillium sp. MT-2017a]|nr:hypothetical protein K4F52_008593 [Lecanicillium sp. MT-2017a]